MSKLSFLGWILTFATALLTSMANLLLRKGVDRVGGFTFDSLFTLVVNFLKLLSDPFFAVGFFMYFSAALLWFRVIGIEPLSIAYPILVSISFVFITSGASVFFAEAMTARTILGIIVIISGIALVSLGGNK